MPRSTGKGTGAALLVYDKLHDGLAQCGESAVKKMLSAWKQQQLRTGFKAVEPLYSFVDVDELILVTLYDKPGTLRLRCESRGETTDRGRYANQSVDVFCGGRLDRNRCTKGKARQPDRQIRVAVAKPVQCRQRIVEFTDATVELTITVLRTAKVEPQNFKPGTDERP